MGYCVCCDTRNVVSSHIPLRTSRSAWCETRIPNDITRKGRKKGCDSYFSNYSSHHGRPA